MLKIPTIISEEEELLNDFELDLEDIERLDKWSFNILDISQMK